ncbi:S8 family serine peptidase [Caloranaerobacter sp. DY30410]|uniref:S8 family serine peptidase n=1 Tax=Caloranaerobacter sp. DY30410 TaxID=3238305 RepID=UPI003CFF79F6
MKNKKLLSLVIIFVILFSMVSAGFATENSSIVAEDDDIKNIEEVKILKEPVVNPEIQLMNVINFVEEKQQELGSNNPYLYNNKIRLIIQNDGKNIKNELIKSGAKVIQQITKDLYAVTIPLNKADKLLNIEGIEKISLDKIYTLDPREKEGFEDIKAEIEKVTPKLFTTLDDTKADTFRDTHEVDGTGVTIAVLDTGVDPGHEMLQWTTNGEIKIIDWQDMTTEGDILASYSTVVESVYGEVYKQVYMPDLGLDTVNFIVPDEITVGEAVYMGTLYEGIFPNERLFGREENWLGKEDPTGFDFNFNGIKESYPILVADLDKDGNYESVYVDTDLDGDFTDEVKLIPYKDGIQNENKRYVAKFPREDKPDETVNFVLTYVQKDSKGVHLNLGFDGGTHGTHVAGIAAGNSQEIEGFTGVAPGAKIMVIKVLGSNVGGAMSHIIDGMIYAAVNGADIVNMSLGSSPDINDGSNLEAIYANLLTEKYGTVFCISAGNEGPGINTIGAPGDADLAITSGAYIEETTWREDYKYDVPGEMLWYFSSIGPREDGAIKPTIVSPGSALSSIPDWAGKYAVYQGTSMSSPHTAGLVALLTESARKDEIADRIDIHLLKEALEQTGRKLDGYLPVEQGGGLVDVVAAYDYIKEKVNGTKYDISINTSYSEKLNYSTGIYVRNGEVPRKVIVEITNNEDKDITLQLIKQSDASWYSLSTDKINIPAEYSVKFSIYFDTEIEPGLYSDVIKIDSPDTVLIDGELPITIAKGQDLNSRDLYSTVIKGEVKTAKYDRNYINVPKGIDKLVIELKAIENSEGQFGRIRAIPFDPNGFEKHPYIGYAGLGNEDPTKPLVYEIQYPQSGNWEIDIYASTMTGDLQKEVYGEASYTAAYEITVRFEGIVANPDGIDEKIEEGNKMYKSIEFTNLTGEEKNILVEGTNLVDLINLPEPEEMLIKFGTGEDCDATEGYLDKVVITEDDPNFLFNVAIESITYPNEDDFDLYLFDSKFNTIAYDADGDASEKISISGLPAGTYYVYIENYAAAGDPTTIKYTKQIVNISDADPEAIVKFDETSTKVKPNESMVKSAEISVPNKVTNYGGLILVKDVDEGTILIQLPVNVETSEGSSGSSYVSLGGGSTDSTTDTEEESEIEESVVTEVIPVNGGQVQDSEGNVELTFEEGTFDDEVKVTVNVIDEKDVESQASDEAVRVTRVYEFKSSVERFNKPVKVKFKYDESKLNGVDEELLGVYTLNEETGKWEYVGGKVDKDNNVVIAELKHFSKYALMAFTKTFADISGHWAEHEIRVIAARRIVDGRDGINYDPQGTITKAEFVKTIVCTLGLEKEEYSGTFTDTKDAWFTGYIEAALKAGIISKTDETFNPNAAITREEMAVIVANALKYVDATKAIVSELTFEDKDEISETAREAVSIAFNNGIIKGRTTTTFVPQGTATRAEAATMIYRFLKVLDRI